MHEKEILERIKGINSQIISLNDQKRKLVTEWKNLHKKTLPIFPRNHRNIISLGKNSPLEPALSSDKITLFRSLFRGRDDVYARLWVSRKTGKSGYSPVCKNEWVRKICQKPLIKCFECPSRELTPLDDNMILKHLEGDYVIGIYPLLPDETCYFLAVDFDKESWWDNVIVFKETCVQYGVPVAVERSRSGNGAHVWIFFGDKIPAIIARKLGSFLITETMSKRYQLDMKSYDRLFPNQDTMPKGGFGNLIALPFQKEATINGNSVFIDDNGNPYTNQWEFLSCVKKMLLFEAEKIAKDASTTGRVMGMRMSPADEDDPPWMRLPSGKNRYKTVINNLPKEIEVIIANKIYIKTDVLPSVFLNQIKRLAAFQNPEFYRRQNMRLSTFLTPRAICCSEILGGFISLPRGCLEDLSCLLQEYGIQMILKDERAIGKKVKFKFNGLLSKEQKRATRKILKNDIGVLVAPSGIGKTIIGIFAIAKRKTNALVLVHRKPLMEQWRMQLSSFFGIDVKDIGQIGGGKDNSNGLLDVAMIQSMERKGMVDDRIAEYGFVIVDECHHIGAVSFERVLTQAKAKYVLGLTATPYRRDGHQPIIHMQCGLITHRMKIEGSDGGISRYLFIPRITNFVYEKSEEANIYDIWPKLITDEERNKLIIGDIITSVNSGRFPIVLTERREHLELLADKLKDTIEHLVILYGGLKLKQRKEMLGELANCSEHKTKAILATGSYVGEGFDVPSLDTLFITMPISFKGRIVQYAGRLHRKHFSKKEVRIYDYVDKDVPVLWKMHQRRLKVYKIMEYVESTAEVSMNGFKKGSGAL